MLGSRGPLRLAGVLLVAMVVYFTRQAFLARAHPWGQPLAATAIWKLPQRLSPVGETAATFPVVDAVGNDVYVAWCGKMTGSTDPFYRHSTDGGDTWPSSATTISSSTSTSSGVLDMAVDGDLGLHFAWREHLGGDDYQLYYNYNAITTTLIAESGQELLPAIAVTSDTVHVVWTDLTGAGSIYYRNKPISGDSWSSATLVAVGNLSLKDPDVAPDDGGNLYLVWSQVHPVSSTVYLRKRTASGNWLTPRGLITPSSSITTQNEHPSVAIDGQNVYVVWGEKIGQGTQADKYITFAKSEDEGTGWTA